MILIINVCGEKLHSYEFVKPIENILLAESIKFRTVHYKQLNKVILSNADKIIICGTSLKDNKFLDDIKEFEWIKSFNGSILGICAGMQIIGLVYGGKVKKKTEVGFFKESFNADFLGLRGINEVYHLHNNFVDFKKLKQFKTISENESVVQAVKHIDREICGVLFHPEVRQKDLIKRFVGLR